jgi:ribonuclease HII
VSTEPTLEVERAIAASGADLVIGCDEVGRGAIAGPVAVGVVAVDPRVDGAPTGLRDSKLLSERRREAIFPAVEAWGIARAVGMASAREIDEIGIVASLGLAARRALVLIEDALAASAAPVVLLDGSHDWLAPVLRTEPLPSVPRLGVATRVKADRDCSSVAAASVLAKVVRDRLMIEADSRMPGYGWAGNKGYGASTHLAAITALGATDLHRRTWLRSIGSEGQSPAGSAV